MCNILCYNSKVSAFNPREKKRLISYFKNKVYDIFENTCEYTTYNNYNYK